MHISIRNAFERSDISVDKVSVDRSIETGEVTQGLIGELVELDRFGEPVGEDITIDYMYDGHERIVRAIFSKLDTYGYIRWIYVDDYIGGNGVGSAVVEMIIDEMRKDGKIDEIFIHCDNDKTVSIVENYGFSPDEELDRRWYSLGV